MMRKFSLLLLTVVISLNCYSQWNQTSNGITYPNGTVTIGSSNDNNTFDFLVYGKKDLIQRIEMLENPVSSTTNYRVGSWFSTTNHKIPSGLTDNGYRMGLRIELFQRSAEFAGTLKSQFGIWSRVGMFENASGTIQNVYGIYIENFNRCGTIENNYGLYQSSSDAKNYFAGNVGIGTTNPQYAMFEVRNADNTRYAGYFFTSATGNGNYAPLLVNQASGSSADKILRVRSNAIDRFTILGNGHVGIGTTDPTYLLSVKGTIGCGEVIVENVTGWADFVFEDDYNLMPLQELDSYIQENKHLPEIPTTEEVQENGISVSKMNAKLLQKIEELTLYTIQQQNIIETLKLENISHKELIKKQHDDYTELKNEIEELKKLIK